MNIKQGILRAVTQVEAAIQELENSQENQYEKDVWVSGGYMRLAQVLRESDNKKATAYLRRAKQIIDANPRLRIRRQQWEKIAKDFSL